MAAWLREALEATSDEACADPVSPRPPPAARAPRYRATEAGARCQLLDTWPPARSGSVPTPQAWQRI